jgi:hypothetical protein
MTVGALGIRGLGGAFEANKLFAGILAIPLAIPLLLGLWLRRPNSGALVAAIAGGTALALVLNFWQPLQAGLLRVSAAQGLPSFAVIAAPRWEVAILATIAASVGIFVGWGWLCRTTQQRQAAVNEFFEKLRTPIAEDRKPLADVRMQTRLLLLFGVAFSGVGLLYVFVSLISIRQFSGTIGMLAGSACVLFGGAFCLVAVRMLRTKEVRR